MIDIEQIANEGKLFDGRYKLLKTLSTDGGTADVWLAIDIKTIDNPDLLGEDIEDFSPEETGMLVAIKIYRPKNALDIEGEQRFRDEYKIVHNCIHTNLLQPTYFSICDDTPYLELPYCKNGSSEMLIGQFIEEKDMWKFIYDVSSGLSYLHAHDPQIIHQDIKPANVLINNDNNYAITDFGISSQRGGKYNPNFYEDNSGTMAYMAPERFDENYIPTVESDIWALGATLYEILTGEVPFKEEGGKNQKKNKMKLKSMGNKIPKDIQKLVKSCLSLNPKERPTANQIIKISEKHLNSSNTSKYWRRGVITLLLIIICVVIIYYLYPPKPIPPLPEPFKEALIKLNSKDKNTAIDGLNKMMVLAEESNDSRAIKELGLTYCIYQQLQYPQVKERREILNLDKNISSSQSIQYLERIKADTIMSVYDLYILGYSYWRQHNWSKGLEVLSKALDKLSRSSETVFNNQSKDDLRNDIQKYLNECKKYSK